MEEEEVVGGPQPAEQSQAMPGGEAAPDEMPHGAPASPELQAQYEAFVAQAFNLVYDQKMLPKIVEMLKGEGDPIEGLARTTALIASRVAASAEEAGQDMPGEVVFHAGTEILEDLAELSKTVGIKDYSEDPDALEGAYFRALDHFRLMQQDAGKLDSEAAKGDMRKLQAMDESGELESMFMGLAKNDRQSEDEPKHGGLMPKETV